ncbi:hypothetical protein ON010_g11869 [Phytophthora cinnamomi]|nr:hypothetical protein ON010_g11869 [Phytophthora cinnamomi]
MASWRNPGRLQMISWRLHVEAEVATPDTGNADELCSSADEDEGRDRASPDRIRSRGLTGVLDSLMNSTESAVHLSKLVDRPETNSDCFVAVATRLADVFAGVRAITRFPPDPTGDGSDPLFAAARVQSARQKYRGAVAALYNRGIELQNNPSPPILPPRFEVFGKPEGFPCFPENTDSQ